ncbi:MAG: SRPBCC domain-containing protein [Pseudomonadota bacterium]
MTVSFEEQNGKTMLTMHALFKTAEEYAKVKAFGAIEGARQTLDKLEAYLAKM